MSWSMLDADGNTLLQVGEFIYRFITCSNIISSSYDYSSWSSSSLYAYTASESTPIQTEGVPFLINGQTLDYTY